jgi:hypothetical protein
MNARRITAACALLTLTATALVAQGAPRPLRKWAVSLSRSAGFGQSGGAVEQAMRDGGFDDGNCFFSSCSAHPFSVGGRGNGVLTVRHAPRPRTQLVAIYGWTNLDETFGFKESDSEFGFGHFVFLEQAVRVAAVLAGVSTRSGATWLAAGPAFFQPRFRRAALPGALDETSIRVGGTVAAGISNRHRFFVEAQTQYRWVGSVAMGPMDIAGSDGESIGTLPRTRVNFNHYTAHLGAGARW